MIQLERHEHTGRERDKEIDSVRDREIQQRVTETERQIDKECQRQRDIALESGRDREIER